METEQDESDGEQESETPVTNPAVANLRQLRDGVREDLAAYGTAVGLAAGTVTVGTAFATFDDLFPLPAGYQLLAILALGLFVVAAAGSILLTQRFFSARRRVIIETSVLSPYNPNDQRNTGVSEEERIFLTGPLDEFAEREGAQYARTVEQRRDRLRRVAAAAEQSGQTEVAAAATAEAARLSDGLQIAGLSGVVKLLEHRSIKVYKGAMTIVLALLVAVGTAGLFSLADWSRGERDRITAFITCQKDSDDSIQDDLCRQLASPTRRPSSPPTPDLNPLKQLNECAGVSPSPDLPDDLRNAALASCAGLAEPAAAQTN